MLLYTWEMLSLFDATLIKWPQSYRRATYSSRDFRPTTMILQELRRIDRSKGLSRKSGSKRHTEMTLMTSIDLVEACSVSQAEATSIPKDPSCLV